jgi:hypothetical protein
MNTQVAGSAWQQVVHDLGAGLVGMFPQADHEDVQTLDLAQPSFEDLRQSSELLARAMGRVVRVNPDHTFDVVARVSPHAAINAYKSYLS